MIDGTMSGAFHSSSVVIVFHSNSAERIPGTSPGAGGSTHAPANLDQLSPSSIIRHLCSGS